MEQPCHGREGAQNVTLREAFELYAREYRATRRESSARRAIQTCEQFVQSVGPDVPTFLITREHVRSFRDKRIAQGVSPSTCRSDLGRVRALTNFLRAEGMLDKDPTFKVAGPRVEEQDARGLTDEEEAVVVRAVAGNPTYLAWVRTSVMIGWRPGECGHVRACDYDHTRRIVQITSYEGWRLKTPQSRRALEVTADAAEILARRKASSGSPTALLFPNRFGKPFNLNNLRNRIQALLPEGTFFTLYALRHTMARRAVEAGWELPKLQLYLGQSSPEVTARYYRGANLLKIGAPPVKAALPMAQAHTT